MELILVSPANKYFIEEPDPDLKKLIQVQMDAWYQLYGDLSNYNLIVLINGTD